MASSKEYLAFVLEQLNGLDGLRTRGMMGEYLLYCEGKPVGGVYDDRLLLNLALVKKNGLEMTMELPYEGAKAMLLADVDRKEQLQELVRAIAADLPAPKKLS